MKQNTGYAEAVFTFLQSLEEELNHYELSGETLSEDESAQQLHSNKTTELKLRIELLTSFIAHHKIIKE